MLECSNPPAKADTLLRKLGNRKYVAAAQGRKIGFFLPLPSLHFVSLVLTSSSYETDVLTRVVPRRDHALACLLRDRMGDASGARRSLNLAVVSSKREGQCKRSGACFYWVPYVWIPVGLAMPELRVSRNTGR